MNKPELSRLGLLHGLFSLTSVGLAADTLVIQFYLPSAVSAAHSNLRFRRYVTFLIPIADGSSGFGNDENTLSECEPSGHIMIFNLGTSWF